MDDSSCVDLCPGVYCPLQCSDTGGSGSFGSPTDFIDSFATTAQQNFEDWGGVSLVAAFVIGGLFSMVFGR